MINTKTLDYASAPKFFYDFENKHLKELLILNYGNYNIWQINKVVLFYSFLAQHNTNHKIKQELFAKKFLKRVQNLIKGVLYFSKWIIFNFRDKPKILFITNSADRLSQREHKYYNSLFDPFITLAKETKFKHYEYLSKKKLPTFTIPDTNLEYIQQLLFKFYISKKQEVSDVDRFVDLWNLYCTKNNTAATISKEQVISNCNAFYAECYFWKFIFKTVKPKNIFSAERVGTGLMAAANFLKIPIFEFQHGGIDKYYPPYVWNKSFNTIYNNIKPDRLVLFGKMAQSIVTATDFYINEDIITIGYNKIEEYRINSIKSKGFVFFALQPMMHELNLEIVNKIKSLSEKYKLSLKYHPLQPMEQITEYDKILSGTPVHIFDKSKSIYDCILESDIVISHVSTVLEEALSLGKVSVTIATNELPNGIHDMTKLDNLTNVIVPKYLSEIEDFINQFYNNENFRENLNVEIESKKNYFYSGNYRENSLKILAHV